MKKGRVLLSFVFLGMAFWGQSYAQSDIVSLEEAITIATNQSTVVGTSREQLQTARQSVLNNYGRFLPNLALTGYGGHSFIGPTGSVQFDSQGRFVQPSGFDYESYSFSLNSGVTLFDWGVNVKSLSSAKRTAEAAQHDLQYQKDIITARAIRAYYNLVRDKYLTRVAQESVGAAQRNLEQVEAFFAIGSNTRADVLQARVRLGNTQLSLITARNNQEISHATLASLLNFPLNRSFDVDSSLAITKVDPDLESEIEYMLDHRSDLLANRKRVTASRDAITAAENRRWPTFSGSFQYSWNDREFTDLGAIFDEEYGWGFGVAMNFNIFDRFATKSSIIDAKARSRISEYMLQQAKLDAILEVKTIHLTIKEADERMRVSEETMKQAEENLRLAEERYRVGAGTILETIDAQVSLTEARSSLVRAKCDYLTAKADLLRASGRSVSVD
ncbi:MAG: TolC family protein [Candidatus Krumholzibacteria bacterium]|nr:TolC family protein [Candidatus Krumholzibacteria bacterium]